MRDSADADASTVMSMVKMEMMEKALVSIAVKEVMISEVAYWYAANRDDTIKDDKDISELFTF